MATDILLIHNDPPCRRCRKTQAVLEQLASESADTLTIRQTTPDSEEARRYGAIMTPMLVIDGKVVSAGIVPSKQGIRRLVEKIRGE